MVLWFDLLSLCRNLRYRARHHDVRMVYRLKPVRWTVETHCHHTSFVYIWLRKQCLLSGLCDCQGRGISVVFHCGRAFPTTGRWYAAILRRWHGTGRMGVSA